MRRPRSIWYLALLLPWVAVAGFHRTFNDNSFLWHVQAGDIQIARGSVLTADPFSYTMSGSPWRTQSWLAELGYSLLDRWFSLEASLVVILSVSALLFVLLGLIAYRQNRSIISTCVFLIASTIILVGFLNPRPVILSFPLLAGVVIAEEDRRLRWLLPLLIWIWAAVHGTFFIGLAYIGVRSLGRRIDRRRFVALATIGLVAFFTAHGWGVVDMLNHFLSNRSALDHLLEWQHPDPLTPPFIPLLLAILGIVWLASRDAIVRHDWWVLAPFLTLSFSAARAVPPAWIALAPIVSRIPTPIESRARLPGWMLGFVGVSLALGVLIFSPPLTIDETRFPTDAALHLSTERVFHDDDVGAWLTYTQWPERKIYIDDRAELFGERIGLMAEIRAGVSSWKGEFDTFGISEALLDRGVPLEKILRLEGWTEAFGDENFVVLRAPEGRRS